MFQSRQLFMYSWWGEMSYIKKNLATSVALIMMQIDVSPPLQTASSSIAVENNSHHNKIVSHMLMSYEYITNVRNNLPNK